MNQDLSSWPNLMGRISLAGKTDYVLTHYFEYIIRIEFGLAAISRTKRCRTDNIRTDIKKREEEELVCRWHTLNTLSDRLYDLFKLMKSPSEIWKTLEFKYNTENQGADKVLIMTHFKFSMIDNISVLGQVHELRFSE